MSETQTLAQRIRVYVAAHPDAERLLEHAEKLESITYEMPVRSMLGIWARARGAWRDVTGEQII